MARFKALIRGAYGEGNFGDDVLMLAAYGILRRVYAPEEIAFVFVSNVPEFGRRYVGKLLPGLKVIRFESEAAAEVVVWGGGTQFYSFPKTRTVIPFYRKALNGLLDPARTYNYVVKRIFGGKFTAHQRFAALGVGIGPFVPGSAEESFTRRQFSQMDFVAVRDDESMRLCREWQVQIARQRSDLAFVPGVWWPEEFTSRPTDNPRRLGIIVRDWPHDAGGAAYDQPALSLARTLRKSGCEVRFIIFRARGDDGWSALLRENGEDFLTWDPECQSIADFLRELAAFGCLLTARYHGALFGALLGRPVIPIEVEPKLRLVSDLLSTGLWQQPFDEAAALTLVADAFANAPARVASQDAVVAQQRQLAAQMLDEFTAFASNPPTAAAAA